jgi:hypothetical protein
MACVCSARPGIREPDDVNVNIDRVQKALVDEDAELENTMQRRNRRSLALALAGAAAAALAVTALGGAVPAQAAEGEITYTLYRSANPTADEQDA